MNVQDRAYAREIIATLNGQIGKAKRQNCRFLKVMHGEAIGKRDNCGWLVSESECDAEQFPIKHIFGAMEAVYRYCRKMKLETSFRHWHAVWRDDHDVCQLELSVSIK